ARVALGTPHVDYNGRYCMSSAAAAGNRAFGIDRGLPFPVSDIALSRAILLVGSNAAETLPPITQWFERQREAGGRLVVADPRLTPTARGAAPSSRARALTPSLRSSTWHWRSVRSASRARATAA